MEHDEQVESKVSTQGVDFETASHEVKRSHESKDIEAQSQLSSITNFRDAQSEKSSTQPSQHGSNLVIRIWRATRTRGKDKVKPPRSRKQRCCRWIVIVVVVLSIFGVIAAIIYISFVRILISRLAPPRKHNGLQTIVDNWKEPDANGPFKYDYTADFSRDIIPKNCHSHNDYWRHVPLYAALAAGCTSVEADIWLTPDQELLVGHALSATIKYRTLNNLYLEPLTTILTNRNVSIASTSDKEIGLFDSDPNISTILLIDMKTDGPAIWPILRAQLQPLRAKNWLTYYDGETLHQGPLTIVGTGQTPFDLIQQNNTNRYIFYDAPLVSISQPQFNTTNSYYASADFKALMPLVWLGHFTMKQEERFKDQIAAAEAKGLKSRYYGTPGWPIGLRDGVWEKLTDWGVGMLNVDDLGSAAGWNWGVCVVAGFVLCGNS